MRSVFSARLVLSAFALFPLASCSRAPSSASPAPYPAHWFAAVPKADQQSWEVPPDAAGPGEVILSKRNELGLLSNFAPTPFYYRGRYYASLEGFWHCMRYPEGAEDERAKASSSWPHTRAQVERMIGFEALAAGGAAAKIMREIGVDYVTFEGRRIDPSAQEKSDFYKLIYEASWAKVRQNPAVRAALLSTGDLVLKPDHNQPADAPPAWKYFEIYMEIREALRAEESAGR